MEPLYFLLLIVVAILNAILQILLKVAAPSVLEIAGSSMNLFEKVGKLVFNPYLISIALVMLGGVALWFKVVAKVDLSRAYPANIALTTVFALIGAMLIFRESLTIVKIAGVVLIVVGIFFVLKY